jgi:POT family proton-dependent oligopeptide transporter
VLEGAFRLFFYAARGKWSLNPITLYKNFTAPGFWDSAKPSKQVQKPAWMTFDDQWVDEVNRGLKACAVFLWFPLYCEDLSFSCFFFFRRQTLLMDNYYLGITYNQLNNNLTSQAATMTTNGLPNDVLSNLDPFALIILIPLCDLFVCPSTLPLLAN